MMKIFSIITAMFAVGGASSVDREYSTFSRAFGKDKMDMHFNSVESFRNHVRKPLLPSIPSVEQQYITCTDYSDGIRVRAAVAERVGENNIHTLYVSSGQKSVCFIVVTSSKIVDDLKSTVSHSGYEIY
jgi:hypothetical protein